MNARNFIYKIKFSGFIIISSIIIHILKLKNPSIVKIFALTPAELFAIPPTFWQIFTAMFIHLDNIHLISNIAILLLIGPVMEYFTGTKDYFKFFIISGLGSFCLYLSVSLILYVSENTSMWYMNTLGLSGAISGLISIYFILSATLILRSSKIFKKLDFEKELIISSIIYSLTFGLLFNFYGFFNSSINYGNIAHFGGFITGIVIALHYPEKKFNKLEENLTRFKNYITKN
ncbi:rhomboid family intramembrane serine protease [Methanococcus sp. CF]